MSGLTSDRCVSGCVPLHSVCRSIYIPPTHPAASVTSASSESALELHGRKHPTPLSDTETAHGDANAKVCGGVQASQYGYMA
jgi:hypothetical protein